MAIIRFDDVSKRYRLSGAHQSLLSGARALARRAAKAGLPDDDRTLWALRHVSFEIQPSEMVGIIGRNGAGKSTMLKLLSKVAYPTLGNIHVDGRINAMIELGAGFHPELSGRDNIYLAGAIQGLRRRDIDRLVEPIIEFAEIRKFIETPVKYYSSGMYARLGFSIATHIESEILLIDEVLSVGDAAFRRKCLDRMRDMHAEGRTIILVSHDTWSILSFCTRAIMMTKGQIEADGKPDDVVERYRQLEREEWREKHAGDEHAGSDDAWIEDFEFMDGDKLPVSEITQKGGFIVRVHYNTSKPIDDPVFTVRIRRLDSFVCCAVTSRANPDAQFNSINGKGYFDAYFSYLPLVPDVYMAEAVIQHRTLPITYTRQTSDTFRMSGVIGDAERGGVFRVFAEWSFSQPMQQDHS